jgi:tetratricopeptide (TPR) repeat protein
LPNDPRLFELTGYILRRRGQHEEGLRNLERAVELDPRNFSTLQQIALSYQFLGRYADAIAALDRTLSIVPDNVETQTDRAQFELFWKADWLLRRRLTQSSHKDRAPSPPPRTSGSFARWPIAIRPRPNARSPRWPTIPALAKGPLVSVGALGKVCWRG